MHQIWYIFQVEVVNIFRLLSSNYQMVVVNDFQDEKWYEVVAVLWARARIMIRQETRHKRDFLMDCPLYLRNIYHEVCEYNMTYLRLGLGV